MPIFTLPLALAFLPSIHAAPSNPLVNRALGSGTGSSGGASLTPQVWIPIVIIVIILTAVAIVTCTRTTWRAKLASWTAGAAMASGTVTGTRELTAEQLAGPGAGAAPAAATTTSTTARPRRGRRTRRTPSQISTRSLPAYMKEPGEQEVVIYRGPTDMEDASTAVLDMPTLDEQAPESPLSSLEMSRSTTRDYNPMPDSPHDMPLLQPDDSFTEPHNSPNTNHNNDRVRNRSSQRLPPPENALVRDRPSFDTLISTEESQSESALIRAHPHPPALDPRGEAPPYFQVVPMDTLVPTTTNTSVSAASLMPSTPELTPSTATTTTAGSTPDPLLPETRRRSGFFGLFNHRPNSLLRPPVPIISPPATINLTTHTRGESTHSALSIPTTSGDGHLPSRSHSPSSSNFIHARTRSRSTHRPSHSGGSNSVFSIGSQALRSLTRQKSFTSSSSTTRHPSPFLDPNLLSSPSSISLNSISAPLTHTLVRTEFMYPKSGPTPEQIRLISGREAVGGKFGVPYGIDAIRYAASQTDLGGGPPPPNFEDVAGEEQGVVVVPASPITSSGPSPSPSSGPSPSPSSGPSPSDSPLPSNSPSNSQEQEGENVSLKKSMTLGVPTTREGTVQGPPSAFKGVGVLGGGSGGRSESRASSYMSFATAEESLVEEGEVEEGEVEDGGDADGGDADADADGVPKLQVSMSARAGAASSRGDEGVDDADDREERDVVDDTPIALPQEYGNEHGHEHEHGHGHGNEDTDVTLTLSTPIGKDDGSLGR